MDKENYVLISGRANRRPGWSGFRRGGVFWPSTTETDKTIRHIGLVHRDLLPILEAEEMITVQRLDESRLPPGMDLESLPVHDVPPRVMVDEIAVALDAVKKLEAEIEREKALAALADKQAELDALRAAREAKAAQQAGSEAKKAPKAPQGPQKTKAEG